MEENYDHPVTRLPAEKIPTALSVQAWVNRKNKKSRWTIENGRWVRGNENKAE